MSQNKLQVVCRYGGNFVEGPDHKVSYKDGTNRLIFVHPEIDYSTLLSELLRVSKFTDIESIKYQHPTLGLDTLVSIENDEDISSMKGEFSSQRNRLIQLFVSGSQKTLPTHTAIPRNEGSPTLLSAPSDPFQFATAQVIVSPLLDAIFGNMGSASTQELRLVWGANVEKELQKLKSTLSIIQVVLEDAEERQFQSKAVQDWLHKFKDVAYDTDDLVNEIVTEAQQSKMAETGTEAGKKRKWQSISYSPRRSRQAMASRIKGMKERLDEFETESRDLHLKTRHGSRQLEIIQERQQLLSSVRDESPQPSTNNCLVSSSSLTIKTHQETTIQHANNSVQKIHNKAEVGIKNEIATGKEPDQLAYRSSLTDHLDASSLVTSFLDGGDQQSLSLPAFCLDGDVQADPRNNLLFGVNIDGLTRDALLSRGFGSSKDLQNLIPGYSNRISSQSFGVPDMSFKPGCSSDPVVNEGAVLNRGVWANRPQRMRTYTKVYKRGSVGKSIDVTHYSGYDELRRDLARRFGLEGQLEDPHRTDWKLVYIDYENDILLVGEDPWEEFVSCVRSIKILSPAEVQQMSLDGN